MKLRYLQYFFEKLLNKSDLLRLRKVKAQTQRKFLKSELSDIFFRSLEYVYSSHVEGDVAEFGTQTGKSSAQIIALIEILNLQTYGLRNNWYRHVHYFDSFVGFPEITSEPDLNSHHVVNRIWKKGGCVGLDVKKFTKIMERLSPSTEVKIIPGYFEESLSEYELPRKISWVHIDCDLYQSTICVLNYLFSNGVLSQGSILLFSDYFANRGEPSVGQQLAWSEIQMKYDVDFDNLGYSGTMSNAFLIRKYKSTI